MSRPNVSPMMQYLNPTCIKMHPLEKLLGFTVLNPQRDTVFTKALAVNDGILGVYFSANWCLPCLTFTPVLRQMYTELKKDNRKFEVVLVSFDRQEEEFSKLYKKMPWLAVHFEDYTKRVELGRKYSVTDLPKLVMLDVKSLAVLARNGREIVLADPLGKNFPWRVNPMRSPTQQQRHNTPNASPTQQPNRPLSLKTNPQATNNGRTSRSLNQSPVEMRGWTRSLGNIQAPGQIGPTPVLGSTHSHTAHSPSRDKRIQFFDDSRLPSRDFDTSNIQASRNQRDCSSPTFQNRSQEDAHKRQHALDFPDVMAKVLEHRERQSGLQRSAAERPNSHAANKTLGSDFHSLRLSPSDLLRRLADEPNEASRYAHGKGERLTQFPKRDSFPLDHCYIESKVRTEGDLLLAKSYQERRGNHKERQSRFRRSHNSFPAHDGHGDNVNYDDEDDDDQTLQETPKDFIVGPFLGRKRNKSLPSSCISSKHHAHNTVLPKESSRQFCPKVVVEHLEQKSLMSGKEHNSLRSSFRNARRSASSKRSESRHRSHTLEERLTSSHGQTPRDDSTCSNASTEVLYLTHVIGSSKVLSPPDHRTPHRSGQLHKKRPADYPRSSSAHHSVRHV